jgi:hypothetical protein
MSEDAKRERWEQSRRKAWRGFTGLPNRLLDSAAYGALRPVAVKPLSWFYQKIEYAKERRRPGMESPVGRIEKIVNNGKISFTYQEARWRGLSNKQFAHALRELHRLGFIDVRQEDLGRGVKGQYTRFSISDRWKKYGAPEWQEIPFPENFREGFRRKGKNNVQKGALQTSKKGRYEIVELPHNAQKGALETAVSPDPQRPIRDVYLDLASPGTASDGLGLDRKVEDKGSEVYCAPPLGGWVEEYEGMVPGYDYGTEGTVH